ncbi:MAG: hypothetical protein RI924_900 [Bacteroidota bacterium]|jgi:hypothetical protein
MKMKLISGFMLLTLIAGTFSACDKKLDIEPMQSVNALTALETDQDFQSAVVGAYSILGEGSLYGTNLIILPDLLANNGYIAWAGTFQSYRQVANKTMVASNAEATRTWIAAYRAINIANTILEQSSKISDAALKTQLEGEAYFIRGIMHFELVRMYGLPYSAGSGNLGVPINLEAVDTPDEAASLGARKTVAEVYTQVVTDLNAAYAALPASNGTRADKYAAKAFLSRVYLQMADYAAARDAANDVIANSSAALAATVTVPFTNRNSPESLFEIQQNDQNNAGTSNDGLATFCASIPGIGRADLYTNNTFYNSFEVNDLRRRDLIYLGTGARASNSSPSLANPRRYTGKWTSFSQNIPVVRLAEMYLTRAECNLRLSTTVGATPADDLAKIRSRAGASAIANPTVANILQERIFELCFEGSRIHDFKRTQTSTGAFTYNDPKLVYPIPEREMRANSALTGFQNPGY